MLNKEGPDRFYLMYHMRESTFNKLCSITEPYMQRNQDVVAIQTGKDDPITTQISLHCLLHWLAGGSYLDVRVPGGMSIATFYAICDMVIDAINQAPTLQYSLPRSSPDMEKIARGFSFISTSKALDGCVGCVDGLLLKIIAPSNNETGHVKSYYSGHYACYGLNIQAVADAKCQFLFASVAAPGGTNDCLALKKKQSWKSLLVICQLVNMSLEIMLIP